MIQRVVILHRDKFFVNGGSCSTGSNASELLRIDLRFIGSHCHLACESATVPVSFCRRSNQETSQTQDFISSILAICSPGSCILYLYIFWTGNRAVTRNVKTRIELSFCGTSSMTSVTIHKQNYGNEHKTARSTEPLLKWPATS